MIVSFKVNGKKVTLDVPPNETLVDTLREKLGLTGTKVGCRVGECGTCTVLIDGKAFYSCLRLTMEVDGSEILTIEGLEKDKKLHPLQEAFIEEDAVQCGFCTPGMIMAGLSLLNEKPNPSAEEVKKAIKGNLCRCGTYYNVVKAVLKAAKRVKPTHHRLIYM